MKKWLYPLLALSPFLLVGYSKLLFEFITAITDIKSVDAFFLTAMLVAVTGVLISSLVINKRA